MSNLRICTSTLRFFPSLFATLVLAAVSFGLAQPVKASQYKVGDATISIDTTLSAGVGIRTSGRDCQYISSANSQGCANDGVTDNYDDGNLNYDQWDIFSTVMSGLTELEVKIENYGLFVRAAYFMDGIQSDRDSTRRTDLTNSAVDRVGRRIRLLDAYVYGNVDVLDMPVNFRIGNQVVNWGESIFYGGGIAETNAFDMTKLRGAGAEVKEAYVPAPMALIRFAPISNLDVSTYYQFVWNETELDPIGTFFSMDDIVGPGAEGFFYGPGMGGLGDPAASGFDASTLYAFGAGIPLVHDDEPSKSGQWGVSARYYSEDLGTEFGAYYMRYHQKAPVLAVNAACDGVTGCYPSSYYRNYVPNQSLYGLSASFLWQDISFGTEINYQPDYPVPLADPLTSAATRAFLADPIGLTGSATEVGVVRANRTQTIFNAMYTPGPASALLGPVIRALNMDDMTIIGEAVWTHFNARPAGSFGERDAAGYTLDISGSYQGAFGTPWVLTPGIAFRHDVTGTALDYTLTDTHIAHRRQVTLRLSADYQSIWNVNIAYTDNSGGGYNNFATDRDFATFTVSYAF